jgi:hypothetical protein
VDVNREEEHPTGKRKMGAIFGRRFIRRERFSRLKILTNHPVFL